MVKYLINMKKMYSLDKNFHNKIDEYKNIFPFLKDGKIKGIFKLDNVQEPFVTNAFRPTIYLPNIKYGQILKIQEDLGKKSTSLWSKNGNKTTIDDYSSDAPELTTTDQNEANVSSVKNTLKSNKKESIDTSSSSAESDSDQ